MPRYHLVTLVDITKTNATRTEPDRLKLEQQANFNTLLQAIGLRSNVTWATDPKSDTGTLPNPFNGKAKYWTWEFEVERDEVFLKNGDHVGLLIDDMHGIPVIGNLTNTVDIYPEAFQTVGDNKNIHFKIIS